MGMMRASDANAEDKYFIPERVVYHLFTYEVTVFAIAHLGHVERVDQLSVMAFEAETVNEQFSFVSFSFVPRFPNTAVAVGVFCAPASTKVLPEEAVQFLKKQIVDASIRFLVGVFGDTRKQMEHVSRQCGAAGTGALHQPWKMYTREFCVYPAYIFVFGPTREVKFLPPDTAPRWSDFVRLPAVAGGSQVSFESNHHALEFENCLIPAHKVPYWPWTHEVKLRAPLDLGIIKQKPLNEKGFKWWIRGVHQLVAWVGTSRTGRKSKEKKEMGKVGKATKGKGSGKKQNNAWLIPGYVGS